MERLVLHEHHVADFETLHEVFNRGSEVTAASPDIFDERDVFGVNLKSLSQPPVVELDTFLLEEVVLVRVVKNLDAEHDEARIMAACQTDVVQVVKSQAELRADKWIGRRVELARDAVRLEAEDTGGNEVNVIAPPCNNGVALN